MAGGLWVGIQPDEVDLDAAKGVGLKADPQGRPTGPTHRMSRGLWVGLQPDAATSDVAKVVGLKADPQGRPTSPTRRGVEVRAGVISSPSLRRP